MDPSELVTVVREGLGRLGDPERAEHMQRYMKTDMPFIGVSAGERRSVVKEAARRFVPPDRAAWEAAVTALWSGPEREMKYAAIDYGKHRWRGMEFVTLDSVPVFESMVRSGAWWDFVDDLAANCVGRVVKQHRDAMRPALERWIEDEDLWVRRTAILAQLKHKDETDADMLFDFCRRQEADKSFWIRKAIGWALRQHARVDPDAVRVFLAERGDRLSGLSRREAGKHL